jgi:tRNA (guanine37-N1)-methyltransferase
MNSLWHVQLLTLFPEMFPGMLGCSLAGKALQSNIWSYEAVDIRHYATDKHQRVDDVPYGGGAGMVMKPDVLQAAISATVNPQTKLLYMSPRGRVLTQS